MDIILIIIGCLILVGIVVLIYITSKKTTTTGEFGNAEKLSNNLANTVNSSLVSTLSAFQNNIRDAIKSEYKTTSDTVNEVNKTIARFGENISVLNENIYGLEKILGNNKNSGSFGERIMEQILQAYFGDDHKLYDVQHKIPTGTPDAIIYMPHEMVCIDSKFPVEYYRRYLSDAEEYKDKDLCLKNLANEAKQQIKNIAKKYIIPSLTSDYAVMFVPSDSLLGLLHTKVHDVIDTALENKVILVSPSTLVPFVSSLRVIKHDTEKSEQAKELFEALDKLADEFVRFSNRWDSVYKSSNSLSNNVEELHKTVNKINNKFSNIKNINLDEEDDE